MESEKELLKIIQETSGCYFHLAINSNCEWTLRIYITKVMFKGTLDEVFKQAIDEIRRSRTISTKASKLPKNHRKNYQYQVSKKLSNEISEPTGNYSKKLMFTKSKGFTNVCEAMAVLGKYNFENEYKNWATNLQLNH